jgi:hypothetical protein
MLQAWGMTVYNPNDHLFAEDAWSHRSAEDLQQRKRLKCSCSIIFLRDAVTHEFDIILELGYSPSVFFYYLNKRSKRRS